MKKSILLTSLSIILAIGVKAQNKKKQDQQAIKDMCGCYEVGFNFAETFEYSEDSTYVPSKVKHAKALEWVQLVNDSKDKISMQHLLIVGPKEHPHIVKHWRQDWEYENTDLYVYDHDNKWTYTSLPKSEVKGQWSQIVFQVDDSPRYAGSASWVHVDGKSYWENTTSAPLPRREYTQRSDYNVTTRRNRHEITDKGWLHIQDNDKVIREDNKEDIILAQEKGYNTYVKVDDSKCKSAQEYWEKNKDKWALVRTKWDEVFSKNKDLKLEHKVDNKELYKYLFDEEAYQDQAEINVIIDKFVKE
ncbi:hypothetical protein OOZ15_18035 [Galbibacter sp. EGI 63066]|uniref:DUF6607 family protein n=1 Tax=Galbibacter sp. EGI 63066 TaxID=2993559 RepID=UPI00224977D3|nr:DUF6607 family protein [Galbibacter sp. EGI 63066]MCX2681860.1 hypothetical protein [Galbibacter sp. EGI 63066]